MVTPTVWYEIIFHNLNGYSLANMPGIDKIAFDYCLAINSWHVQCLKDPLSQSGLSKGILLISGIFGEL